MGDAVVVKKKASATGPSLEGTRLGRYRLRYRVAQGGMASVYLAQLEGTHGFERWVAVKVVHPHLSEQRRFADMLLDEARVAARIHHPNVCAMLDFGEQDGVLYLVMEYLHGESFSSTLRRAWKEHGHVEPWLAARVVLDAAMGLEAAHELADKDGAPLGVVHRDVSPQNIQVLYQGQSKVVDFGIARARGRLTSTEAGEVKGKLSYMSPEQIRNQSVDRRADVWALGVVLWEATTGRRLFRTDSHGSTVMNVVDMDIPRPTVVVPGYPPALEKAVLAALQRDPDKRTASAADLGEQLEEFIYSAGRPAGPRQVAQWMRLKFADKLQKRDAMLRSADGNFVGPAPEVDLESESSVASRVRGPAKAADAFVPESATKKHKGIRKAPVTPPPSTATGLPDTKADIVLPEAAPSGRAVPPPPEPDGDDYGATVVADPPMMEHYNLPISGLRPSPKERAGAATDRPVGRDPRDFDTVTTPDESIDTSKTVPRARALSVEEELAHEPKTDRAEALPASPEGPTTARADGTGSFVHQGADASPSPPPIATPFAPSPYNVDASSGPVIPRAVIIAAVAALVLFIGLMIGAVVALSGTDPEAPPAESPSSTPDEAQESGR